MTEEQETASREARANQKRSVKIVTRSVNMSWRRTDSEVPADVAAALKVTPVEVPQAQDVEMADAGVAKTTAGVSLQSALRKPVCVQINATQHIAKNHRVTYSVGTKSGSAKV